jgi:hypothetical protein
MAEYRIRETGEIITNLATQFPNTSLPFVLTQSDFDALGIDPVLEGPQPTTATPYQFTYRDGVEEIEGQWFTKYAIGPVFTDYTDEDGVHTAAEQEVAYKAQKDKDQWSSVRADRNAKLAACDWTQLPDAPLTNLETADWGSYRQALRDITTQSDPFNINWPVSP